MKAGLLVRWAVRIGEALVAATILLMLVQLHISIVQSALTMVGARTDAPMVLAVEDSCTSKITPPAWAKSSADSITFVACSNRINVIATLPLGEEVTLFVNDRPVESMVARSPVANFVNIELRPGFNTLLLAGANSKLEFPHPLMFRGGFADERSGQSFASWDWKAFVELKWRSLSYVEAPFAVQVISLSSADGRQQGPASRQLPAIWQWYGPYEAGPDGSRSRWYVAQGLPGSRQKAPPNSTRDRDTSDREWVIGLDGFATVYANDLGAPPAGLANLAIKRELRIGKGTEDMMRLSLSACLPREHPFVVWSRAGLIGPTELITRLTGLFLYDTRPVTDAAWRNRKRIDVGNQPAGECTTLEASYESTGLVRKYWGVNFLQLPGDRLLVDAELADTLWASRPADGMSDKALVWSPSPEGPAAWNVVPTFRQNAVQTRRTAQSASTEDEQRPTFQEPLRQRLLDRWSNLSEALPPSIQAMLWGFALVLPVGLIYWALGRHGPESPDSKQVDRARTGVFALLVFMTALAVQQILSDLAFFAIDAGELWSFIVDGARVDTFTVPQLAPIAFVAAVMIVPLLRAQATPSGPPAWGWTRIPLAVLSLSFVVLAIGVAALERWIVTGFTLEQLQALTRDTRVAKELFEIEATAVPLAILTLTWCLFGALVFWIPIYWLARVMLPRGAVAGSAFVASVVLFFVPIITPLIEALRVLGATATSTYGDLGTGPAVLSMLAAASSIAGVVIMVTFVLRGFREITAVMLDPAVVSRFRSWTRTSVLLLVAILIVGPTMTALANVDAALLRVHQVMTVFQAYGLLLALLAPFAALRLIDGARVGDSLDKRFRLDGAVLLLLTAAFAGYLSLWAREPFGAPILVLIGWFVFSKGIIGPPTSWDDAASDGLARRILAFRMDTRLLKARQKAYEKEFSEGKIDAQVLAENRAVIATATEKLQAALGMPVEEAKRRLLGLGLGVSPLRNGLLGAGIGLAMAALFQVILPINFRPASTGAAPAWISFLTAVLVDPGFQPIGSVGDTSRLLAIVSELLNALAIWVFLGFMFGVSFHRIRGSDGFAKAIVFGTGIAVTFLVSQALIARGGGVPFENLARLLPIFAFLIFLGSLVFDGRSLRRQGVSLGQLPELYGMRASVGYLSFAGALAGAQPVFNLLEKLFSPKS